MLIDALRGLDLGLLKGAPPLRYGGVSVLYRASASVSAGGADDPRIDRDPHDTLYGAGVGAFSRPGDYPVGLDAG